MSEIIFGTPEHVAGLSRKALEEDFRWVNDRRMELEGECERLDAENAKLRDGAYAMRQLYEDELKHALAENAKLRELVADMLMSPQDYCEKYGIEYEGWSSADDHIDARMRELGVEVDE